MKAGTFLLAVLLTIVTQAQFVPGHISPALKAQIERNPEQDINLFVRGDADEADLMMMEGVH